jgi:large subunit ribosomal protein L10
VNSLAFTKQHKGELLAQYVEWLKKSQAVYLLEYSKMKMKDIETIRAKAREAGGEIHVVKNTLLRKAMEQAGYAVSEDFSNTTLAGFALKDAPALAKVFSEVVKDSEVYKLKGGFLDLKPVSPAGVIALANLPPLPVMRARLLGMFQTPASQLVRTLAEPARQVAYVIQSYSEKEATPVAG